MRTQKYLAEFIGAFFLTFTFGMAAIDPGAGAMWPLAVGLAIAAMTFACAEISGAHFNPAVTIALWMRRKLASREVAPYLVAQTAAAVAAAVLVLAIKGEASAIADFSPLSALVAEFLFAFSLVWVALNCEKNPARGIAVGAIVSAGAFAAGPISGGAFNPAVAIGISAMGLAEWPNLWVYILGGFGGGACASLAVFFILEKQNENESDSADESDGDEADGESQEKSVDAPTSKRYILVGTRKGKEAAFVNLQKKWLAIPKERFPPEIAYENDKVPRNRAAEIKELAESAHVESVDYPPEDSLE